MSALFCSPLCQRGQQRGQRRGRVGRPADGLMDGLVSRSAEEDGGDWHWEGSFPGQKTNYQLDLYFHERQHEGTLDLGLTTRERGRSPHKDRSTNRRVLPGWGCAG